MRGKERKIEGGSPKNLPDTPTFIPIPLHIIKHNNFVLVYF